MNEYSKPLTCEYCGKRYGIIFYWDISEIALKSSICIECWDKEQ